jgi:hypothetical protein
MTVEMCGHRHPFTAPAPKPRVRNRCRNTKTTIRGTLIMTDAAISIYHSMLKDVTSIFMTPVVSGRTSSLLTSTRA